MSDTEADLLQRYIAGEVNDEEAARIGQLLAADLNAGAGVEAFKAHSASATWHEPSSDIPRVWDRISGQLIDIKSRNKAPANIAIHKFRKTGFGIGALLAAGILAVFGWQHLQTTGTTAAGAETYTTRTGQRANITLKDGSQVTLAPATTLQVTGRNVRLKGEALFTVIKNANSPFTVTASGVTTRVLGTTFAVRAYDDVRVAVAEGRVMVNTAILSAGDVAQGKGSELRVTRDTSVAAFVSWTTGKLVFDNVTLREVISDLNRWYGADVRVNDESLLSRRVTTVLENETLRQAIVQVAYAVNADANISGTIVNLSSKQTFNTSR